MEKKQYSRKILAGFLLTLALGLSGCALALSNQMPVYEQMAEALFANQLAHPAQATNVDKKLESIADTLSNPYGYERGDVALLAEEGEPLTLSITYHDKGAYTKRVSYDWVYTNAIAMYSIFGDIERINVAIMPQEETFSISREEANTLMGGDVQQYAKGKGTYTEFWKKLSLMSFGMEALPGLEVYVWKNRQASGTNKTYYTLLTDTMAEKTEKQIYSMSNAVDTVIALNREIAKYPKEKELILYQLKSTGFSNEQMRQLQEQIRMPNEEGKVVLGEWTGSEELSESYNQQTANLTPFLDGEAVDGIVASTIEKKLTEMVGDSKGLGLADECIVRHPQEYQDIKNMGVPALKYMLSKFQRGTQFDLKGEIMQKLCMDMLGSRVLLDPSVTYDSPQEWFDKSGIDQLLKLPEYEYPTDDSPETLVAKAYVALKPIASPTGAMIVTPKVHFVAGEDTAIKVFASLFVGKYEIDGENLNEVSAEVVPVAVSYSIHNGTYVMENYQEPDQGAGFAESVAAMCTMPEDGSAIDGLAETLVADYEDYSELTQTHKANINQYIQDNALEEYHMVMANFVKTKTSAEPVQEAAGEAENAE